MEMKIAKTQEGQDDVKANKRAGEFSCQMPLDVRDSAGFWQAITHSMRSWSRRVNQSAVEK
jgi:hypothetical protein